MKNISFLVPLFFLFALCGCRDEASFRVVGTIEGAADSMLYLEHLELGGSVVALDSAKLDETGRFELSGRDTCSSPEFYRLRIAGQVVNLAVDSTETITVAARYPRMAEVYTVEGSGECDTIRLIAQRLFALRKAVERVGDDRRLTIAEREEKVHAMVEDYKDTIKINYIQERYDKASSYYALFQRVGDYMVFDLRESASDVRWAAAVANAWVTAYPHSPRAKNLENLVLQGRRNTHRGTLALDIDNEKVHETGIIDMGFPDLQGCERRLSDLKGKVVLLEFTAYAAQGVADHNIALREFYAKYHEAGLEIYQVSIDPNIHLWKTVAQNLPWICVYAEEGEQTDMLRIYQVQALPSYFLIDRNNDLSARGENIPDLEAAVRALL